MARRLGIKAALFTGMFALTLTAAPGTAHAAQWNPISQTLNGTSWTKENYVRTVTTTPSVDVILKLENKPGCCLDLRLSRAADGTIFAEKYNMQTLGNHVIATGVLPQTRFNVWGRNSVSDSDRYWSGQLYY